MERGKSEVWILDEEGFRRQFVTCLRCMQIEVGGIGVDEVHSFITNKLLKRPCTRIYVEDLFEKYGVMLPIPRATIFR